MTDHPVVSVHLTDRSVSSITRALREFGYATLTEQEVREASERVLSDQPSQGIIDMFIADYCRDAGVLSKRDIDA
jgi:hypothetical protein